MEHTVRNATGRIITIDDDEEEEGEFIEPPTNWGFYLPAYPPITSTDFMNELVMKKELWDTSSDPVFFENQVRIARFMQYHSVYDSLLLCHEPGTGKSSAAVAVMDQLKQLDSPYHTTRTLFVANNQTILNNFRNEIMIRSQICRSLWEELVQNIQDPVKREAKWSAVFQRLRIDFATYHQWAKDIEKSPTLAVDRYNNSLIIMDECHHLIYNQTGTVGEHTYQVIHDILHRLSNKKLLLLTGTPMHDQPEEVVLLWNLMLPLDQQLPTGRQFVDKYFDVDRYIAVADTEDVMEDDSEQATEGETLAGFASIQMPIYRWKPGMTDTLAGILQGRISYLKQSLTNVRIQYIGQIIPPMAAIPVSINPMSDFQSHYYLDALQKDVSADRRTATLYNNSIQASLFVFPNGSYGEAGFSRFCSFDVKADENTTKILLKWKMDEWNAIPNMNLRSIITTPDLRTKIEFIRNFSSTYGGFLDAFLRPENLLQKACVYSSLVAGSGIRLLALILRDIFHFEMITRSTPALQSQIPKNRFIFINDIVRTPEKDIQELIRYFNRPENSDGRFCRLILITNKMKEGISLFHIQQIHILTPSWNFSDISQAIARGIRARSHAGLRDPKVDIFLHTSTPKLDSIEESTLFSVDYQRYLRSEIKDRNMGLMQRFMTKASWDCVFTHAYHMGRVRNAQDGSRECDYDMCMYKCWPWSERQGNGNEPFQMDAGNSVMWYDNLLFEKLGEILKDFFVHHRIVCFKDIIGHVQEKQIRASSFEILYLLTQWIEEKMVLRTADKRPMILQFDDPYYICCMYPSGLSGLPADNHALTAFVNSTAMETNIMTDLTPESFPVVDTNSPIIEITYRVAEELVKNPGEEMLSNRLNDLLILQQRHLGSHLEMIWGVFMHMFSGFSDEWKITGFPDGQDELPLKLRVAFLILSRIQSTTEKVRMDFLRDPNWWRVDPSTIRGSHTLYGTTGRRLDSMTQWIDNDEIPPEVPIPPMGATRRKLLPREEMSADDIARFITDNQVGFYGMTRGGKFYIRDVRNKEIYRTEDRKLIPQGKDCTSFRMGDLVFIYLCIVRHMRLGDPYDDPRFARWTDILHRFRTMPRSAMEEDLKSSESFPQFRHNFPDSATPEEIFAGITDNELRHIIMFMQMKKNTDGCGTLLQLFQEIGLFRTA